MDIKNPAVSLSNEEMEKIVAEVTAEEVVEKKEEPKVESVKPEPLKEQVAEPVVETPKEEVKEEEEKVVPEPLERPIKAIPIAKYQAEKHKWREQEEELNKKITELESKIISNPPETQKEVKGLAEKYGVDENLVNDLVGLVSSKTQPIIPEDLKQKLDFITSTFEEKKQESGFEKEFSALEIEYPEVKENKTQLKELAFTEGYQNKTLFEIYFRNVKKDIPVKKKSAESSRGGSQINVKTIDYSAITPDEVDKMSDKEFEEYQKYLVKNSESVMTLKK